MKKHELKQFLKSEEITDLICDILTSPKVINKFRSSIIASQNSRIDLTNDTDSVIRKFIRIAKIDDSYEEMSSSMICEAISSDNLTPVLVGRSINKIFPKVIKRYKNGIIHYRIKKIKKR